MNATLTRQHVDLAVAMLLLEKEQQPKPNAFAARYMHDPAAFVRDCFTWKPGEGPTNYQNEILSALVAHKRATARGPHGLGKTALAAWMVIWFALTRDGLDWKVVTTASAWRQLQAYLWPELHKWARRLRWDVIGRAPLVERQDLLDLSLKLTTGSAFAVASDVPALIEGAHADHLLYLFDESKTIPAETFDAAEGAFSGAGSDTANEALALAVSTPGEPQGRFYEIHKRAPGFEDWWTRHVTLAECLAAGRVSRDWVEQRRRQWGEDSAVFKNRVLGEFASSEEDGVIPLAWIEAANERWQAWHEAGRPGALTRVGADIARSGEDQTVLALRYGDVIGELRYYSRQDTMATEGLIEGVLRGTAAEAVVDVIGIGAGVYDKLKENKCNAIPFNASERSERLDRSGQLGFSNLRSEGWWTLRELLDPSYGATLALPLDDNLTGDLTAPHWRVLSGGKIQVESKDDIKKRIRRSTDAGDGVMQALVPAPVIEEWTSA